MPKENLSEVARQLAETLEPGDLDETLRAITGAAVEVLPDVELCSITVRHADGRLQTVAPTDEVLYAVDAAQYELREGPCYDAATDTVHVTAPWLARDDRFPRYRKVALDAGIQSQAGIRLFESEGSLGALNLYSRTPSVFQDLGFLGVLFTHQSAMALKYAREIGNLRDAVATRQLIGEAVGIVMERYAFSEERAFAFLARLSQHSDAELREVAGAVVEAAQVRAF